MKRAYLFSLVFLAVCMSCDPDEIETKTKLELISQSTWSLENFSTNQGEVLTLSDLNTQALLLFSMNYEFLADGEVRGLDKASGNIIQRGVWEFVNNEKSVNVVLGTLNYDFEVLNLKTSKMSLRAPTGNFMSGVGDQIILNFSAK